MRVRPPQVAGVFYPKDPRGLKATLEDLLGQAPGEALPGVRGLVAPHAGYRYAGRVAARAFRALRGPFNRVFLLGPAHFYPFQGVSLGPYEALATPLGLLPVDLEGRARLLARGFPFLDLETPHREEHSLEVLLPFLQATLGEVPVLPLLFGEVDPLEVALALAEEVGPGDLVLVSTDLSHYHPEPLARSLDGKTLKRALALDPSLGEACGLLPWRSLTLLARGLGWRPRLLAYATSAEAGGGRDRVVGYAALAYLEAEEGPKPGHGEEEKGQGKEEEPAGLTPFAEPGQGHMGQAQGQECRHPVLS